jgi:putative acetyltransferase
MEFHIRPEQPGDQTEIRHVTKRAFAARPYAGGNEQDIIDALRRCGALAVSLVAEHCGRIVGHAAFSPAVPEDSSSGWYTLGPVAVEPEFQRRGVGKALVHAGIARLQELDAAGCIVLGDTGYYSQFGFVPAPENAPAGAPPEHFMVLRLGGPLPNCRVDFHDVFYRKE